MKVFPRPPVKKIPWIQIKSLPRFFFVRPTKLFLWDLADDKFPPWIKNGRRFVQIRKLQGALRWGLGEFRGNTMVEIIVNAYSIYICIFYHISYISILQTKNRITKRRWWFKCASRIKWLLKGGLSQKVSVFSTECGWVNHRNCVVNPTRNPKPIFGDVANS